MATARDFKFCTRVGHVMIISPKWAWSGSRDPFLHFGDQDETDEARHSKFDVDIERKEYCHCTC